MIRNFEEKDLDRVMEIWLAANLDAHGFIRPEYWRECFSRTAEAIAGAEVYLSEQSGVITGFIGLDGDFVEGLFVDKEYRGQGAGKALLDRAKESRQKLGLCVYERNEGAVRFYEREGFQQLRKKPDISTGETEILMRWDPRRIKFDLR